MSDKPVQNPSENKESVIDLLSKIVQIAILSVIITTLLLSPVVIYYFTSYFESKLPVCTAEQPASETWRCTIEQSGKVKVVGGNPAYCPEGKQHFTGRAWCNFNWDRPIEKTN